MKIWEAYDLGKLPTAYSDFYKSLLDFADMNKAPINNLRMEKKPPLVNASYLDDKKINARVMADGEQFNIGINIALPSILHFYFNNIFRTSNFMPGVGNPVAEKHYRKFPEGIPLELPSDWPVNESIPYIDSISRPIQDSRAVAAIEFTRIAVSFCIYHEIAHVYLGHVLTNLHLFAEEDFLEFMGFRERTKFEMRLRQVWEYEADKIASYFVFDDILFDSNVKLLTEIFNIEEEEDQLYQLISIGLAAIFSVFNLFGCKQEKLESYSAHPHPMIRFGAITQAIITSVPLHLKQTLRNEEYLQKKALIEVMNIHTAWMELDWKSFKIKELKNWKRILKIVEKIEQDRIKLLENHIQNSWFYPIFNK